MFNSDAEQLDHTPLTFGKYKGKTPDQVSNYDPNYLVWLYDTVTDKPTCSKLLRDACSRNEKPRYVPRERTNLEQKKQQDTDSFDEDYYDPDDLPF